MDAYETIISKRDVRHYTESEISDESLGRVLQAGRMAGSAKNRELNRLIVVRDQAVQDALANAGDFSSWIGTAQVVVGFASPAEGLRSFDIGRQAQNMMLAAHAEGIASCPVTMHHPDKARAAVGLPDDWELPMVITLGWPVNDVPDSPLKRDRLSMDELVRHDRWS
ncbi:MAG: nitroreductase family protein [Acidimicrobiia bacterium]|nr:nitroreductase family protein [Acidimicrobiia bacterium]